MSAASSSAGIVGLPNFSTSSDTSCLLSAAHKHALLVSMDTEKCVGQPITAETAKYKTISINAMAGMEFAMYDPLDQEAADCLNFI